MHYLGITHKMEHFPCIHMHICTHIRIFEGGWASAMGGCMRSIHEYIHRLGISIVNHKGNCLHIYVQCDIFATVCDQLMCS